MNNNEFLEMFERELSKYTGAPYVVLTDSCTNAIFLILTHLRDNSYIPSRLEIVTIPENTYVGVAHSIINTGFQLRFDNINWRGSYQIGDLPIWDSAVDLHKNMYEKYSEDFVCLSFQQKKRLNIGKGGAILCHRLEDYNALKKLSFDGRGSGEISKGFHMNMTPNDAAKGLLILNQISLRPNNVGSYLDYPNLSNIDYFKNNII